MTLSKTPPAAPGQTVEPDRDAKKPDVADRPPLLLITVHGDIARFGERYDRNASPLVNEPAVLVNRNLPPSPETGRAHPDAFKPIRMELIRALGMDLLAGQKGEGGAGRVDLLLDRRIPQGELDEHTTVAFDLIDAAVLIGGGGHNPALVDTIHDCLGGLGARGGEVSTWICDNVSGDAARTALLPAWLGRINALPGTRLAFEAPQNIPGSAEGQAKVKRGAWASFAESFLGAYPRFSLPAALSADTVAQLQAPEGRALAFSRTAEHLLDDGIAHLARLQCIEQLLGLDIAAMPSCRAKELLDGVRYSTTPACRRAGMRLV